MKLIQSLLIFACGLCNAAPSLLADPYPATGTQPSAAVVAVNGGTPQACTLRTVAGGLQPVCDLASITVPGTYTLVMTVSTAAGCTGDACTGAGSASSAPFSYRWLGSAVPIPALRLSP